MNPETLPLTISLAALLYTSSCVMVGGNTLSYTYVLFCNEKKKENQDSMIYNTTSIKRRNDGN